MIEKLLEKIQQSFLQHSDHIWVLAVSGGLDSMVLYDLFKKALPKQSLHIVHVNHQIAKESDSWSDFVRQKVQDNKDFFHEHRVVCHPATEEIARKKRYEAFEKTLQNYSKACLVLAHHYNDQEETLLWRFLRGSPIQGLKGMSEWRPSPPPYSFKIYRPLLEIKRQDLEQYAAIHQIPFINDPSNSSLCYTRNFLRHSILPQLPSSSIVTSGRLLEYNFLTLRMFLKKYIVSADAIDIKDFLDQDIPVLWTVLSLWIYEGQTTHPSEKALHTFCEQIYKKQKATLCWGEQALYFDIKKGCVRKTSSLYIQSPPESQVIELDLEHKEAHGSWGIYNWIFRIPPYLTKRELIVRKLYQKESVFLFGKKQRAENLWLKKNLWPYERPWTPAVFDRATGECLAYGAHKDEYVEIQIRAQ